MRNPWDKEPEEEQDTQPEQEEQDKTHEEFDDDLEDIFILHMLGII